MAVPVGQFDIADEWTLYTGNGFVGEIAGNGKIDGTTGFQDISVLAGASTIIFDGTFNKGGDILRLEGDASAWSISSTGSTAILTDGDTFLSIPIGSVGMAIEFADGVRSLRYDLATQTAKIGAQSFGAIEAAVTAAPDGSTEPNGADDSATSRLYMASGGLVAVGGDVEVRGSGTTGEIVGVASGDVVFDGTFNKGGDIIVLTQSITSFTAQFLGSRVILHSDAVDVNLPIGPTGTTILFASEDETLRYDTATAQALIGSYVIGPEAAPLFIG